MRDCRDGGEAAYWKSAESRAYLERVVAACVDAEFNAYQELPDIDEALLLRWFRRESGAYRDLIHTLTQLKRRGWVLSNPCNPSTKRLLAVEVKEMRGNEAVVRTTEYWYLRWWSTIEQKYRYPYRETNRHTYILVKTIRWMAGGREHSSGAAIEHTASPAQIVYCFITIYFMHAAYAPASR